MTAVVVDTSVWRRYFAGDTAVMALGDLLDDPTGVLMHPWVVGELVLGGLSEREERLLEMLSTAPVVADGEVVEFIRRRGLMRRGIGWVDAALLASTLTAAGCLWTLDKELAAAARDLGAAYSVPGARR